MNILEFAKEKFSPTSDQEEALLAIDGFLSSEDRCFLLKGYAGTGKTTITKAIAEYVKYLKWNPVLLAPTGRAARILSDKTGFEASTIHRGIYNLNDIDEIEIKVGDKVQYKFRFNLNEPVTNITQVYLIDEASMISDKKSESDFFIFGSGILLKDIITYLAPGNKARNIKLIFIGDPAQLPPVTDSVSGALSSHYLSEKYQIQTQEFELTQVVRQEKESGILHTASYIRERMYADKLNGTFKIDAHNEDISILNADQVADKYIEQNPRLNVDQTAIINYSNNSALEYNLMVREKLFNNKFQIAKSDLLMINQNNYNYEIELFNGTMVRVLGVNPIPKIRSNIKSYDQNGNECRVSMKFREITISVPYEKDEVVMNCMILEDFLYSRSPQLDYAEHIALYLDFKYRHPDLKPKTKAFKDALRSDPYFNALRVKYGYAITCHKAQGGEWKSVFVNLDLAAGRHSEAFNRWFYTAITRAKDHLYIFNYNTTSPFSKLEINFTTISQDLPLIRNETIFFKLDHEFEEMKARFLPGGEEYFLQEKFKEIAAVASHYEYKIIAHNRYNYQEQFTFAKDGFKGTLIFWYNGKKKFTRVTIFNTPANDVTFCNKLLDDFTHPVNIIFEEQGVPGITPSSMEDDMAQKEILFPEEKEFLSVLYENIKDGLLEKSIYISQIDHGQFHEIYTFHRGQEKAKISFYYNGKQLFTDVSNLIKDCNSNNLLKDIENILIELKNKN